MNALDKVLYRKLQSRSEEDMKEAVEEARVVGLNLVPWATHLLLELPVRSKAPLVVRVQ